MKSRRDNIGHTAHFGGAVSGFITTLFIYPKFGLYANQPHFTYDDSLNCLCRDEKKRQLINRP